MTTILKELIADLGIDSFSILESCSGGMAFLT